MEKLDKILIGIIVILFIVLAFMTYNYINIKQILKRNTDIILEHAEQNYELSGKNSRTRRKNRGL